MQGTVITVAEIISPQPGKKQYSVIDMGGQRFGVFADHIGEYAIGCQYRIDKVKNSDFKGKTYYTLEESTYVGGGVADGPAPTPPPQQRAAPPRAAPPVSAVQPVRQPAWVPQPPVHVGNAADDARRMDIFVCGGLNNILSNPNVIPDNLQVADVIRFTNMLRAAWRNTMLAPNSRGEMNDEIPL